MASSEWWTTFFEGQALELWRRAHTLDVTRGQANDIARALGIGHGTEVLDVPCGNGRIALELAAKGARVRGLDRSAEFIREGRRHARERGLELELVQGDMRALPWQEAFDAALCVGNSFGYMDDEGNLAFLAAVARALRSGGRFLLEYPLVAELVRARRVYRDWHILGERLLLSDGHYDADAGRLETSYTFVDLASPGGALESRVASYRVYSARELVELLERAGFGRIELFCDLEPQPFDAGRTEESDASEFFACAVRV